MKILTSAFLSFAALTAGVGFVQDSYACGGEKTQTVRTMTIKEAQKAKPTFVDVNSDKTRERMGVIPGALLASYEAPTKALPEKKDSELVFYCANTQCSASKTAAMTAMNEGYSNVAVLPVGIKGWKEAGLKTVKPVKKNS